MQLIQFDTIYSALQEATTVGEIKEGHDKLEALRYYVQQQKLGYEIAYKIAVAKLEYERKGGYILGKVLNHNGGKPRNGTSYVPLSELGLSKNSSSKWQKISLLAQQIYQNYLSGMLSKREIPTSNGLLRFSKEPKSSNDNIHFSSETSEWYTPVAIIGRVIRVLGTIDLDPCSNGKDDIPASLLLTLDDNGLSKAWNGHVYMNPPYGREISGWINKLASEYEQGNVTEAIALTPSRTDTEWFRRLRNYPRCFIWGRLRFSEYDNSAPFPSMVTYLGGNINKFVDTFNDIGDIYTLYGI